MKLAGVPKDKGIGARGGRAAAAGRGRAASHVRSQRGLAGAMAARAARLVLVVGFQVLLHVVGSGELLVAARECALDRLFRRVDFGVARGMARGGEGLFASMALTVAAGIALDGALGD